LLDHATMSGIDHPEKYWINPSSEQAQQAQQQNSQQQQEQQGQMMQAQQEMLQVQMMEIRRNWENDVAELKQNQEQFFADLKFKYDELDQKGEVEEAKIVGNATLKLEEKAIDAELRAEDNRESAAG